MIISLHIDIYQSIELLRIIYKKRKKEFTNLINEFYLTSKGLICSTVNTLPYETTFSSTTNPGVRKIP